MHVYLKKRKLYALAKSLVGDDLPLCKEFSYSHRDGAERLVCGDCKISSLMCGGWIHIINCRFDETTEDFVYDEHIFSDYRDGRYLYHSSNGEIVVCDL